MKRDMGLIREIILQIEADKTSPYNEVDLEIQDRSGEEISYHVKLLHEAGLIEAEDYGTIGHFEWKPRCLTWEGHEFLDNARNDKVWNKSLRKIGDTVGTVSMNVFTELLKREVLSLF